MRNPSPATASGSAGSPASVKAKASPACCSKASTRKGAWTAEEDEILSSFIRREGVGKWRAVPKRAGLQRCGKSCRLRWMNYLRPSVKRGQISPDEEDLILRMHRLLGNRWSLIAGRLPGRTDNEIKNYWNTHLSKKLISEGIDPRTHRPLSSKDWPSCSNEKGTGTAFLPSTARSRSNPNPNILHHDASPLSPVKQKDGEGNLSTGTEGNFGNYTGSFNYEHVEGLQKVSEETTEKAFPSSDFADNAIFDDSAANNDDFYSSFLDSLINDDVFLECSQSQGSTLHDIGLAPSDPQVSVDQALEDRTFCTPGDTELDAGNGENRDVPKSQTALSELD